MEPVPPRGAGRGAGLGAASQGCKVPTHLSCLQSRIRAEPFEPCKPVTKKFGSATVAAATCLAMRQRCRRVLRRQQGPSTPMAPTMAELNLSQQQAVCAKASGALLIIAGAGSGKTRVLTERLAWLLKEGVDPKKVVLLTFTKSAAVEMKERARNLVGAVADDVLACTFHSFCARVLRKYAVAIELPNDFVVLSESDAVKLVRMARKQLGFDNKINEKVPKAAGLKRLFSRAVAFRQSLKQLVPLDMPEVADAIEACHNLYEAMKKESKSLDFDDLQIYCNQLLEDEKICKGVAENFQHILVDEYQDTDVLQETILRRLFEANQGSHGHLTVVGDDAQGIYGFRGAAIENIQGFEKTFPDASVCKLEQNYRSHQNILNLANKVMSLAHKGYRKTLYSERLDGLLPTLSMCSDQRQEAQWVLQQLQKLHEEGCNWRDTAVLFRQRIASKVLEAELSNAGVPYHLVGGKKLTETGHVRDLVAVLQCAFFPRQHVAWKRVLTLLHGVGEVLSDQIYDNVFQSNRLDPTPWAHRIFGEELAALAKLIDQLKALNNEPQRCVQAAKEFYLPYFEETYPEAEERGERAEDFLIFEDIVADHDTMQKALYDLTLDLGEKEEDRDVLKLSTIHGAKGLEWNNVFIIDLEQRWRTEPPEEELRVLYVGITRARQRLFLSCPSAELSYWLHHTPQLHQLVELKDFRGQPL